MTPLITSLSAMRLSRSAGHAIRDFHGLSRQKGFSGCKEQARAADIKAFANRPVRNKSRFNPSGRYFQPQGEAVADPAVMDFP
jgi:hypothetical protein